MFFKNTRNSQGESRGSVYPLMPLRDIVVFPYMITPLFVGRQKSVNALEEALRRDKNIFLVAQKQAKLNDPAPDDVYEVGTLASIIQLLRLPDGSVKVLAEGKKRAFIKEYIPHEDFFQVLVEEVNESQGKSSEVQALMRNIITSFENYVRLSKKAPPEMISTLSSIEDPSRLGDTIAAYLTLKLEDKQHILEAIQIQERLEKIFGFLESENEILQIERRIRNRVKKQMEKTQKDYYLAEQMKAIQKEMGDKDELAAELKELEERIKKKKMSEEATNTVTKEFKKLKMIPPMSAEVAVVRNYIDWILSLPWHEKTENKLDITEAEKILEEDHYGLQQVKERIIEYLSVQTLVNKIKGPILCFVGPPGVGKTSLAKSIARSTGRKFVRLSLGGVRDEAEIRGHRRTYVGALPGKILQSMKKAGSNNPVFLLDEVDKMSTDFRGDPSSALLEVLDPEQNHTFNDHYIDIDYDLSEVMFITTANNLHQIPPPLQDRMEIIRLAGYTELEKLNIAKKFLIPKQIKANGLGLSNVSFTENAILTIIRRHTREAGVRNLEREIASICRKIAKEVVRKGKDTKIKIGALNIPHYLGVPKFRHGKAEEKNEIGVATGLAWTEVGGELLVIETAVMSGRGKLTITGKLGDVMQESVQAAMSYVRSRTDHLGINKDLYRKVDIHVHVPEGAIPKDGPSAGIAIATSIASALTKMPVRSDIAMTGEITLRGRVLPIGGLKEKILAAHRGNIYTVIIPKENEKDLKEIPDKILKSLDIILVEQMDEVLQKSLMKDTSLPVVNKGEKITEQYVLPGPMSEIIPQLS